MKKFTKILLTLCLTFWIFSFTNAELSNDKKIILDQRVNKIISNYDLQKLWVLNSALKKFDTSKYSWETLETIKYVISKFENEYNKKVKEIWISTASNEIKNQAKKFLEYSQEIYYDEEEVLKSAKLAFYKNPEWVDEVKRLLKSWEVKLNYIDIEKEIYNYVNKQKYEFNWNNSDIEHLIYKFSDRINKYVPENKKIIAIEKLRELIQSWKIKATYMTKEKLNEEIKRIHISKDIYYDIDEIMEDDIYKRYWKNSLISKEIKKIFESWEKKIEFRNTSKDWKKISLEERKRKKMNECNWPNCGSNTSFKWNGNDDVDWGAIYKSEALANARNPIVWVEYDRYDWRSDKDIIRNNIKNDRYEREFFPDYSDTRKVIRYIVTNSTIYNENWDDYFKADDKLANGRVMTWWMKYTLEQKEKDKQKK